MSRGLATFLFMMLLFGCGAEKNRPQPDRFSTKNPSPEKDHILDPNASIWDLGHYQVVEPGMTLWRLAHENNVDLKHLAALNGITDPTEIEAGTVLWIPGASSSNRNNSDIPFSRGSPPPHFEISWPFKPGLGELSSSYGAARKGHRHQGADLSVSAKEKVLAVSGGVVAWAGKQRGYGKVVYIDHGAGWQSRYAHLDQIKVSTGDKVKTGEVLGKAGKTGRTYGKNPHLHFELRFQGKPLDPWPYLSP